MRPFPEKTGSPSVPVPMHRRPPRGLDCARAVLFGGGPAGEIRHESFDGQPRPGAGRGGNAALAAAAARY